MTTSRNPAGARDKLIEDFTQVVADTESLLRSLATTGGEKAGALRAGVEERLQATKERLRELQDVAVQRTTAAAHATDDYVHENPWQAIGVAATVGLLVGLIISSRR
jgi:ElaB/YqjD/DUF883 family membrane-anchored ribosome-binding protein